MNKFKTINILDLVETIGEDEVRHILSDFSCLKNIEIENFVKQSAIEFAKRKMSITYLVVDDEINVRAIFTLTHKAIELKNESLSNTSRKKIEKHSKLDKTTDSYMVSAFLIAQFGKNDTYNGEKISGNELMDFTFKVLLSIQHDIGGGIVYLECEEKEKLIEFYSSEPNIFTRFGERYSISDATKYIQFFKFI